MTRFSKLLLLAQLSACGLPAELEAAWRGNVHDQKLDPEADSFKPDGPSQDAGPSSTDAGTGSCGDGHWTADEECDASADDRFPCDQACMLIRCDQTGDFMGDKACESEPGHSVCVRYQNESVCLPRNLSAPELSADLKKGLYSYCANEVNGDMEVVLFGEENHRRPCWADEHGNSGEACHDGTPVSQNYRCHTFEQPDEHRGLVINFDPNDHQQPMAPQWQVLDPSQQGNSTVDLHMACVPGESDFCLFARHDSLETTGLKAFCSGEITSGTAITEPLGGEANACVLAECKTSNSSRCNRIYPVVNPSCSDLGNCQADSFPGLPLKTIRDELFNHCAEACHGDRNKRDPFQMCFADGTRQYPGRDGSPSVEGPALRCANCNDCNGISGLNCHQAPGNGERDRCAWACDDEGDCPHGRCSHVGQNGGGLCEPHGPAADCENDEDCSGDQYCQHGHCRPPCTRDQDCGGAGEACQSGRCQGSFPNQPPAGQRCDVNAPDACGEDRYCNHVWDSDEQEWTEEGMCMGASCNAHENCPFGQYCAHLFQGQAGYCTPWTGCQNFRPNNGNSCTGEECHHGDRFCVPVQEAGFLAPLGDRCVTDVPCSTDNDCRETHAQARCANRVCVRLGDCDGVNANHARTFPGVCLPSMQYQDPDHPNSPNSALDTQALSLNTNVPARMNAFDRDVFLFEAPDAGRYQFNATGGDPWCSLFSLNSNNGGDEWVNPQCVSASDGGVVEGQGDACRVTRILAANERVVFAVEPFDRSANLTAFNYGVTITLAGN